MRVGRSSSQNARPLANDKPGIDITIPTFGYKSSVSICRTFGIIRKGKVTDAARFDGRMLRDVVTNDNTASDAWATKRRASGRAGSAAATATSRAARRCPNAPPGPMRPNRRFVPVSNMCSPGRRTRWGCSSAPSASSAPKPRSPSPTLPTTCTALSPANDGSDGITAPETHKQHRKPAT